MVVVAGGWILLVVGVVTAVLSSPLGCYCCSKGLRPYYGGTASASY